MPAAVRSLFSLLGVCGLAAGPFVPGSTDEPHEAVDMHSTEISGWADSVESYQPGPEVDSAFADSAKALGNAVGDAFDIVSLGRGGSITLSFSTPFSNGAGWDFAVFENSINDSFLELAFCEVSSDGISFIRFPNISLTTEPVSAFGSIQADNISGFAGKYRQGKGTPFDLETLKDFPQVWDGSVDLSSIRFVRLVDVLGDGSISDNRTDAWISRFGESSPLYDPYPTVESAGFDLDAVAIRFPDTGSQPARTEDEDSVSDSSVPGVAEGSGGGGCLF